MRKIDKKRKEAKFSTQTLSKYVKAMVEKKEIIKQGRVYKAGLLPFQLVLSNISNMLNRILLNPEMVRSYVEESQKRIDKLFYEYKTTRGASHLQTERFKNIIMDDINKEIKERFWLFARLIQLSHELIYHLQPLTIAKVDTDKNRLVPKFNNATDFCNNVYVGLFEDGLHITERQLVEECFKRVKF